ncbi:restriction endonuclease subunit S [Neobacillus jeddahensis]|uniref:restriction endonuclease subunit S n=1 Tax=Neobacillus jeddahensis TaxID=1461580 RepID=UPI00058E589C|nr:restriction endonuclease subunit S [Neobacillus jeddahensis]
MSFKEWEEVSLKDVIHFNPTESIKKGTILKKIGMDKLSPFHRKIEGYELTEFMGGSKFRNGDTLLARITPCLENGKTAQVTILNKDEIGFGSTEFIVLREKVGITDNNFIYYLSISPEIRNISIKSMTGTTGRQRAQTNVIENTMILLPPLKEQKEIANIFSSLDEKIEINNQINKKLEEMAQAIFKQWFVDFEFPNDDGEPYKSSGGEMVESEFGIMPKGWEISTLKVLGNFRNGKGIKEGLRTDQGNNLIFGSNGVIGRTNEILQFDPCIVIGRVGAYCGSIQLSLKPCWITDNAIIASPIKKSFLPYLYRCLLNSSLRDKAGGSAQPLINQSILNSLKVMMPPLSLLEKYYNIEYKFFERSAFGKEENIKVSKVRDTLLPKLMSGEIRVPLES